MITLIATSIICILFFIALGLTIAIFVAWIRS